MTRVVHRTILMVVGLVAYVLLTRGLYLFIEMDSCLDDGGVIDEKTGTCEAGRSGFTNFFDEAAPFRAWVFLFAVPILPSLLVVAMVRALLRPWAPPSNSALVTDVCGRRSRAFYGAAQRGR